MSIYSNNCTKANSFFETNTVKKAPIPYQDRVSFRLSDQLVGRVREGEVTEEGLLLYEMSY